MAIGRNCTPTKRRKRNNDKSSIGRDTRCSITMNATSPITAAANSISTAPSAQPRSGASISAQVSRTSVAVKLAAPAQSTPRASGSRVSRMRGTPNTKANVPTTAHNAKIARQPAA